METELNIKKGITFAILAAALYAINAPFSKILLDFISPTLMAGFLYVGAGIRLRFIRKTHCQKDFMLWRGSARLGGVSGVDFNVLGNPAELIRKLKVNTDIAVFVNLDMVYQLNQNLNTTIL